LADVMAITKWSIASPAHTVALSLSKGLCYGAEPRSLEAV